MTENTCVIGGRLPAAFRKRTGGEFASTWSVSRASAATSGPGISDSVPRELGLYDTYWQYELVSVSPPALGAEPAPLPFATTSVCVPGRRRAAVGYQPTGMKPIARARPGCDTSNTA